MVRRIKICPTCNLRYVSHGGKKNRSNQCGRCFPPERGDQSEERFSPFDGSYSTNRQASLEDSGKENNRRCTQISATKGCSISKPEVMNTEPWNDVVDLQSIDGDSCDGAKSDSRSEGGDEFNCTQIHQSQDSFVESKSEIIQDTTEFQNKQIVADALTIQKEATGNIIEADYRHNKSLVTKTIEPKSTGSSIGDICFICGADLSGLKRRIDHIKRCSKKHGITGRDVRLENSSSELSSVAKGNVHEGQSSNNWHGDAEKLLKLTNEDLYCTISSAKLSPTRNKATDSTESSSRNVSGYDAKSGKFVASISSTRNLNNVLMAGSRRLEIETKVANKRGEIERGGGSNKDQKRTRYSNWNCPMYKKITGTDFVVDGFHYAKHSLTKNYFLTHFHSDHYGGITSSWDVGTIFCSLATAALVNQQLRVDKKHIHPLPMNTPTVIESRGRAVTVTLLDANHCPGAVMFFFEIGKRNILHVGDFRWSRDAMLQDSSSVLQNMVSGKVALDELYLDTTYCNEKYHLPPQSKAIKATIQTFEKEMKRCRETTPNTKALHLFGAYTIGKEKIFLSVAEHFGLKVYVDKARYRILSTLNLPEQYMNLLTTNKEMSDMWVVPMGHLNMKKMPEYFAIANSKPFAPAYNRIIGYRPTGWSLSRTGIISSRSSGKLAIHSIPYSEHSSFPELVDCLACLKPAKIIPTVSASKSDEQVKLLMQALRNKQAASKMFSTA